MVYLCVINGRKEVQLQSVLNGQGQPKWKVSFSLNQMDWSSLSFFTFILKCLTAVFKAMLQLLTSH